MFLSVWLAVRISISLSFNGSTWTGISLNPPTNTIFNGDTYFFWLTLTFWSTQKNQDKIRTLSMHSTATHRGIRSGNTFVFTFQNKPVLKHMPWTADTTDSYVSFSDCHCCCYHLSGQCQVCWPWKSVQLNQLLIIILICCLFYVLLSFWMYIFLS